MASNLLTVLSKTCQNLLPMEYKKSSSHKTLMFEFMKKQASSRDWQYKLPEKGGLCKIPNAGSDVYVVLLLKFSQSNTLFSVLTSSGKTIFSGSSGSLGLRGKQKTNRQLAVRKIARTLKEVHPFLIEFGPLSALHIVNVGPSRSFVIKTMKQFFLLTSIKSFDLVPYNGCRKKKMRRKKRVVLQLPK